MIHHTSCIGNILACYLAGYSKQTVNATLVNTEYVTFFFFFCQSSQTQLTHLHITCEGTIEDDGYGMLQVGILLLFCFYFYLFSYLAWDNKSQCTCHCPSIIVKAFSLKMVVLQTQCQNLFLTSDLMYDAFFVLLV